MVAFYARYAPLRISRFALYRSPQVLSRIVVGGGLGRMVDFLWVFFAGVFLFSLLFFGFSLIPKSYVLGRAWCLISLSVSTGTRVIDGRYWAKCFKSDRLRPSNASFSASFSALYVMVVCWGFALSVQSTKSQYSALQIGLSASLTRLIISKPRTLGEWPQGQAED